MRIALAFSLVAVAATLTVAPPAEAQDHSCVFVFSMTEGSDVNNLDLTIDYAALDGDVEGLGQNPVCRRALGGNAFVAFRDLDEQRRLTTAIIRFAKFSAPVALGGCRVFYDSRVPVAGDFAISVTNAGRDGEDNNVKPTPKVKITSIECPGQLPSPTGTTTTTVTSTSLTVTTSTLVDGFCGQPTSTGDKPTASDALAILKAAVGLRTCALCICDVDDSGKVSAVDALATLRAVVGQSSNLNCPPCS